MPLCHSGILHIDVEDQVLIVAAREPSVRITIRSTFVVDHPDAT